MDRVFGSQPEANFLPVSDVPCVLKTSQMVGCICPGGLELRIPTSSMGTWRFCHLKHSLNAAFSPLLGKSAGIILMGSGRLGQKPDTTQDTEVGAYGEESLLEASGYGHCDLNVTSSPPVRQQPS